MKTHLEVRDLRLRRENGFELRIDRLQLAEGQIYHLMGANGAGKSTLLHLLAQLVPADSGEILFNGQPVNGSAQIQALRRQVTLVEQSPFLFDSSVYHNIAFGLRLRNIKGAVQRQRVASALADVRLSGFEKRRARELSGGETRRVALARALALDPKILLLDEPTAGLDADTLPVFETLMTQLAGRQLTLVLSSHDAQQSQRLPVIPLFLDRGELKQPKPVSHSQYHNGASALWPKHLSTQGI
ncbi:MAG: ATP-binding cassette domain-containing protein [Deltaproteobacteria bacterium]|nr:ATP-binding cassette domain-containing protein [Deltaproteobacteria bacterium]